MPRQIPWSRLFAEGLAIIVLILLAFGIQAWWDDHLDRRGERILLAGLLADLQADSLDYAEAVEEQERRILAADLLLDLAGDPGANEDGAAAAREAGMTAGEAFDHLGRGPRLETVRVSYDQITAAGISEVIGDPELRQQIARYYAVAADWTEPVGSNGDTLAAIAAFEAALNRFGFTWADGERIPAQEVLSDPTLRAVIRRSRRGSQYAAAVGTRLLSVASDLMDRVAVDLH